MTCLSHWPVGRLTLGRGPQSHPPGFPALCTPLLATRGHCSLAPPATKQPLRNSLHSQFHLQGPDWLSDVGRERSHSPRGSLSLPEHPVYPTCREPLPWARARPGHPATWSPSGSFSRDTGNSHSGGTAPLQAPSQALTPPLSGVGQEAPAWARTLILEDSRADTARPAQVGSPARIELSPPHVRAATPFQPGSDAGDRDLALTSG